MNELVSQQTEGVIKNIIQYLPPHSQLVLLNTLHFKEQWAHPFLPAQTQEQRFYSHDNGHEKVKMMQCSAEFRTASLDDARVLVLPFDNTQASMAIILPNGFYLSSLLFLYLYCIVFLCFLFGFIYLFYLFLYYLESGDKALVKTATKYLQDQKFRDAIAATQLKEYFSIFLYLSILIFSLLFSFFFLFFTFFC